MITALGLILLNQLNIKPAIKIFVDQYQKNLVIIRKFYLPFILAAKNALSMAESGVNVLAKMRHYILLDYDRLKTRQGQAFGNIRLYWTIW